MYICIIIYLIYSELLEKAAFCRPCYVVSAISFFTAFMFCFQRAHVRTRAQRLLYFCISVYLSFVCCILSENKILFSLQTKCFFCTVYSLQTQLLTAYMFCLQTVPALI